MAADKGTVLIVNSDQYLGLGIRDILEIEDFKTFYQPDPRLAADDAQRLQPDLVLTTFFMPYLNGVSLCQHLKANPHTADIPVVFTTTAAYANDILDALRAGVADYLISPFPVEEMLETVTEQIARYRARRQQIEALREQEISNLAKINRLQDEVLRVVSHDLKVPLSVIKSSAQMLREDVVDLHGTNNRLLEYISMIDVSVKKMTELVVDLLDAVRLEETPRFDRVTLALSPYLRQALEEHKYAAKEKGVRLTFRQPKPDITVSISPERMGQALQNLLSNAVKYTPNGGKVILKASPQDNHVYISITDTGLGIPTEALHNLFQKFYRVPLPEHQAQSGTGLGLAIAKTVVEQHGGKIEVTSALGQGSTFTIVLPLDAETA